MARSFVSILIPILLVTSMYIVPLALHQVSAAPSSGEVCLGLGPAGCPLVPPLFNSTAFPSPQLRVPVFVNNSQPLNLFDIILDTNHTILKPAGVDITGSLLAGGTVILECVGGIRVSGPTCSSVDGPDTLHYAVSGSLTSQVPTSGLLFTALFNVMTKTNVTTIGFQTGCSGESASPLCVNIGGVSGNVPETVQIAKYTNSPYFDFQPSANSLTIDQGGTDFSLGLNVTSINDFQGTVNIVALYNSTAATISLSPTSVTVSNLNAQGGSSVTVHVQSTTKPGTYNITFVATSGALPQNVLYIPLHVPVPDFSITSNPSELTFNVSVSSSSLITVTSLGNFSGRVNLGLVASPGLQASLVGGSSFNVNISSPAQTTLKVNSTVASFYNVNITATSGTLSHTIEVKVLPVDFAMSLKTGGVLQIPLHQTGLRTIYFNDATTTPYNVTITMTKIEIDLVTPTSTSPSTGLSVSCRGNSYPNRPLIVFLNNTNSFGGFASCTVTAVAVGNFTVTVIGSSAAINHAIQFPVQVPGPDYTIVESPPVQTVAQGSSVKVNVTLTRSLGFNDTIFVSAAFANLINGQRPGLPTTSLTLVLNASSPEVNATFTITSTGTTPVGAYTLAITGSGKTSGITHSTTGLIIVVSLASPVDIRVVSVTASATSAMIGSSVTITVQVENFGKVAENSTVIALAGDLTVDQQNVTLLPGKNLNVTLTWQTGTYSPGSYVIGGKILGVPGEANYANNQIRSSTPVVLTAAGGLQLGSPYIVLAIVLGVIAAIVVALIFLRSRKPPSTP